MPKKQAKREQIPISEAAVILGISKSTFYKFFRKAQYEDISIIKYREGWMADLMDVFHYAYPGMSEETIAMLIYKYRADRIVRKGRK